MTGVQAREIAAAETAAAGEELLWWGQPAAWRVGLRKLPLAASGFPFAAFAAFWMAGMSGFRWPDLSRGGIALFPLFGLPFFLLGLALVLAPAFAWRAGLRTVYAATRSGVWIVRTGRTRKIERHVIQDAREFRITVRPDGSGDLVVAHRAIPHGRGGRPSSVEVALVGVPDIRRVERIVASIVQRPQPARVEPEWGRRPA